MFPARRPPWGCPQRLPRGKYSFWSLVIKFVAGVATRTVPDDQGARLRPPPVHPVQQWSPPCAEHTTRRRKTFTSDERNLVRLHEDAVFLDRDAPFFTSRSSDQTSPVARGVLCARATDRQRVHILFGARINLSNLVSPTQRSEISLVSEASPLQTLLVDASSALSRSVFVHRMTSMDEMEDSAEYQPPHPSGMRTYDVRLGTL